MKIEIDTKHDSAEEIKKVIGLLTHLIGSYHEEIHSNRNIFDDSPTLDLPTSESSPELPVNEPAPSQSQGNVFGNLFENKPSSVQTTEQSAQPELEEKPEKEETPEVVPY